MPAKSPALARKTSTSSAKAAKGAATKTSSRAPRKQAAAKAANAGTAAKPAKPAAKTPAAVKKPAAAKTPATVSHVVKPAAPGKLAGSKAKQKLVRDSFTMPQADFSLIEQLKARALAMMRPAKKSELLRAGLHALAALSEASLRSALDALTPLKPGRPKKSH